MFPEGMHTEKKEANLSIALLGNRIHCDQTLVEYLIEFLLVFASAKDRSGEGKLRFHTQTELLEGKTNYYVNVNAALRRFIFYNNCKQESRSVIDDKANQAHWNYLRDTACDGTDDIDLIHDLLHSYTIVTRNRGWYAQALLPVSPELLLPDLQGIKARQKDGANWDLDGNEVDDKFIFDKHNFLARGGQMLYLHLLQGLQYSDEAGLDDRSAIEALLRNMLQDAGNKVSLLADFVQQEWDCHRQNPLPLKSYTMGYVQDGFSIRAERFVQEVRNFLSCDIHPIARIELLSQGLVLSLLRAMHVAAAHRISPDTPEPLWIMDMSDMGGTSNIAKLSAASYRAAYDSFLSAMSIIYDTQGRPAEERFKSLQDGKKESADIFKNLAKEMKLVIPSRGSYERFSLPEPLARYLVLSLIKPDTKMTLDTFLERLYDHFRIVIAPAQYRQAVSESNWHESENMADYFDINARCFQDFLKQCGFLRDLSDATAIVVNPYQEVVIHETAC